MDERIFSTDVVLSAVHPSHVQKKQLLTGVPKVSKAPAGKSTRDEQLKNVVLK